MSNNNEAILASLTPAQQKSLLEKLIANRSKSTGRLSHAQARLWFLEQLHQCPFLYHVPLVLPLPQGLDLPKLSNALNALVQAQPVLRSYIKQEDEHVKQYVAEQCDIKWHPFTGPEALLPRIEMGNHALLDDFFLTPFALDAAPLFRAGLLTTPDQQYLLLCFHHLITDGWSVPLMVEWLNNYLSNPPHAVEVKKTAYSEFIHWEHQQTIQNQKQDYWQDRLLNKALTVDLITDFPRKSILSGKGKTLVQTLSTAQFMALRDISYAHNVSENEILLFAFQYLLSRYSGQDDIILGIPVLGRPQTRWYETIGLFVNTCLHHVNLDYEKTIEAQLKAGQSQLREDLLHSDMPYDEIIKSLYARKQLCPNQSFNILYNYVPVKTMTLAGDSCTPVYCTLPTSKFDLSLHVYASESSIELLWEYSSDLYHQDTIEQLVQFYLRLLETLPQVMNQTLAEWVWVLT